MMTNAWGIRTFCLIMLAAGSLASCTDAAKKFKSKPQSEDAVPDRGAVVTTTQPGETPKPELKIVDGGSCMRCHNGGEMTDYTGPGIENPHPFGYMAAMTCVSCHGGNPDGKDQESSHVPPPPQIGDRDNLEDDPHAYFNRLTLAGIDKFGDYTVRGKTYKAADYLQFINPGDMRVVSKDRGCGQAACHGSTHGEWMQGSPLVTETGFFSGAAFSIGLENAVPQNRGLYQDTAADYAFRRVEAPKFSDAYLGSVSLLLEVPEKAQFGRQGGIYDNDLYDADTLQQFLYTAAENIAKQNQVKSGSPLADLFMEQVSITCGDCHLGSAGANNRYADFRSSGCTSCHMQYAMDGRSRSSDPNINKKEPENPDAIAAPERAHVAKHVIRSVARKNASGTHEQGIDDTACVGCHQGSNRTVLQYWGIRLDQNEDLHNETQYPANPVSFKDGRDDRRLFDPEVGNETFNGRRAEQLIVFEDYDGDGRDDTPEDVHYEAGMGCIDCHGSRDLHNGTAGDKTSGFVISHKEQAVGIRCESCHGGVDGYAPTKDCTTYDNTKADCVIDRFGNPLRHVNKDGSGQLWLTSRVTGKKHFVPQTRDTVTNNEKKHPVSGTPLYNAKASYAMGRVDSSPGKMSGPLQAHGSKARVGFSHTDSMNCATCHASWTNTCTGCHLANQYDDDPDNFFFSNITGERIVLKQAAADFTYQTPVPFYLSVDSSDKVAQSQPSTKVFYRYIDKDGDESRVFAFSDRKGEGNNTSGGRNAFPAMAHNQLMAHSIRGKVEPKKEGPRYCVSCHLTEEGLAKYGAQYAQFRQAVFANDFTKLDYTLLSEHLGKNPSNQLNSPIWVHASVGLGTGLFLFDETGCPVNPLDENANRQFCPDGAPAENYNPANVRYDLDKIVQPSGISNASSRHPMANGKNSTKRDGSQNPGMAGPMGKRLLEKLADPEKGLILDSWIDADGNVKGKAGNFVK